MARRPHTLIIGYGNSLRRDDGAGLVLAQRLAKYWQRQGRFVRSVVVQQLTPDLAFDITAEDVDAVVFIDAVMVSTNDAIRRADVEVSLIVSQGHNPGLGHHMDASELMVYAHLLYRRRPDAWMVTVPGSDFAHGEGLSEGVRKLVDNVQAVANTLEASMGRVE